MPSSLGSHALVSQSFLPSRPPSAPFAPFVMRTGDPKTQRAPRPEPRTLIEIVGPESRLIGPGIVRAERG